MICNMTTPRLSLAAEIRGVLEEDPTLTGPQVVERLQDEYPDLAINLRSFTSAYSRARRQLGIIGLEPELGARINNAGEVAIVNKKGNVVASSALFIAARDLLSLCGYDADRAAEVIKGVSAILGDDIATGIDESGS